MQVRSLGQEDPLEKEMATTSNILAWRLPWTEEPGGLQSMGSQRIGQDKYIEKCKKKKMWMSHLKEISYNFPYVWDTCRYFLSKRSL